MSATRFGLSKADIMFRIAFPDSTATPKQGASSVSRPNWTEIDLNAPLDGIIYEKGEDGIATITINRPERGNSLHEPMHRILRAVWEDIRADDGVRVVIVTGAGHRHFSTGADMGAHSQTAGMGSNVTLDEMVSYTARQNRVWKPTIAAVNGTVAGAGLHFVVDADIVVACDNVTFLDSHVNVGIVGGLENIGLTKRMPFGTALRMSLQGRDFRLTAARAYQIGLVDELVGPGEAMAEARKIASSIAANSPQALTLTQQALWSSLEMGYEASLNHAWALIRTQWTHPDFFEGPRAFNEKRTPRWNPDPDARQTAAIPG
jgi:enoyl-CoA hydratase/carnithine racemase